STPNIIFIEVNQEIISNSIEIYNKVRLDPRDAIHLASMQSKKVISIVSTDSDFDEIKEIKRIDFRR
ncbi:MAG: PIN domain-containing protein, partial [Nanoarchaeota archaeon]